jgi:ankyrin repeat protein
MRSTAGWQSLIPLGLAVLVVGAADRPPLIDAAKNTDSEAVRALLKQGANVNAPYGDGTTALHWASYRDDLTSADLLIRAGAKVNAANDLGATPLWAASQNGSETMVKSLLAAGANPNAALYAGETPVMVAARSGKAAVVELLLAKGGNPNVHGARGQTALMWAVAQQHPDVVKVLLAHGADVHARSDVWNQVEAVSPHGYLGYNRAIPHGNDTALMFASRVGDLDSAKVLVEAGANVHDMDAWGVSATVLAAHSGFGDLVDFLLEQGADPNSAEAGFSALHTAIMRRDEKMVTSLLAHGADPHAPLRTWTPTRRASDDHNFPPTLVGASPYWLAARFAQPNVMRRLLKAGADPLFVHHAEYYVSARGVSTTGTGAATLVSVPALYVPRTEASNAVMAAVGMGGRADAWVPLPRDAREAATLEAVKVAAEFGVDLSLLNNGKTALDGAKTLSYQSVVKFLEEHDGAKPGPN